MDNKTLRDYIRELTLNDKKTLTQKTLKLVEEVGELSRVVLPYEGAYATNHRVVDRQSILEELADVFLVNQSILYSMGFSDEEFQNIILQKARIWQGLQVKEDRAFARMASMPYEIHVTVDGSHGIFVDKFKGDCAELKVKPIVLALQNQSGTKVMSDVMTSSTMLTTASGDVFNEMNRIVKGLQERGYRVVREKIEAAWWHPKAPFEADGQNKMPEDCYFECHLNVKCTKDRLPLLGSIAKQTGCHLSQNAFKVYDDESFTIMITHRSYDKMYEGFNAELAEIKSALAKNEFKWEKEIVEFSIYDTKISHDVKWIDAKD